MLRFLTRRGSYGWGKLGVPVLRTGRLGDFAAFPTTVRLPFLSLLTAGL